MMKLMMKTFWMMSSNIDRIQAQQDMRALTIGSVVQSSESAIECRDRLVIEVGTIVKLKEGSAVLARLEEKMDAEGLEDLRRMT